MYNENTYSASALVIEIKHSNLESFTRIETYNWLRDFVIESVEIFMDKKITKLLMSISEMHRENILLEIRDKIRRKANIFAVKNTDRFYNVFFNNYSIESFNIHLLMVEDKDFEFTFKAEVAYVCMSERERWSDNHPPRYALNING